jgi:hypothetical protein
MDAKRFIEEQLRTTGGVPIDETLAKFLAPELHGEHEMTANLTTPDALLRQYPRTHLARYAVEGFGEVLILTRSMLALEDRIGLVVGSRVRIVADEKRLPAARQEPEAKGNPPRPCRECGQRTGDSRCRAAIEGRLRGRPADYKPDPAHPRRCIEYTPGHHLLTGDYLDLRTGRELWPDAA